MKSDPCPPLPAVRQILAFVLIFLITWCAPLTGFFGVPGEWYAALEKPSWNPPSWIFGPVWSLLYTLMAVAAWLVWRKGGWPARRKELSWYGVQLLLNAAWTPLFFGLRQPGLALVEIVLLNLAVALTIAAFFSINRTAGWLMIPYQLWLLFAAILNATLWWMNR